MYELHIFVCTALMVAIPVGIPFAIGKVLYGYHDAILLHEGPHE
eukprot:COSAG06_NODE_23746_length_682_cov_21.528302_1_plen_43_part_10